MWITKKSRFFFLVLGLAMLLSACGSSTAVSTRESREASTAVLELITSAPEESPEIPSSEMPELAEPMEQILELDAELPQKDLEADDAKPIEEALAETSVSGEQPSERSTAATVPEEDHVAKVPSTEPETALEELSQTEAKPETVSQATPSPEPDLIPTRSVNADYVLNINTMKFHYPSCSSVSQIKDENRQDYTGTRDEVVDMGFSPCGRCKP